MRKDHYALGRKYEPIDVINDWDLNFNIGNAVKYLSRYKRKGTPALDLTKAIDYIKYELEMVRGEEADKVCKANNCEECEHNDGECCRILYYLSEDGDEEKEEMI